MLLHNEASHVHCFNTMIDPYQCLLLKLTLTIYPYTIFPITPPICHFNDYRLQWQVPLRYVIRHFRWRRRPIKIEEQNRKNREGVGVENKWAKNTQAETQIKKETKFRMMGLSGFILCCAVKHTVTTNEVTWHHCILWKWRHWETRERSWSWAHALQFYSSLCTFDSRRLIRASAGPIFPVAFSRQNQRWLDQQHSA